MPTHTIPIFQPQRNSTKEHTNGHYQLCLKCPCGIQPNCSTNRCATRKYWLSHLHLSLFLKWKFVVSSSIMTGCPQMLSSCTWILGAQGQMNVAMTNSCPLTVQPWKQTNVCLNSILGQPRPAQTDSHPFAHAYECMCVSLTMVAQNEDTPIGNS